MDFLIIVSFSLMLITTTVVLVRRTKVAIYMFYLDKYQNIVNSHVADKDSIDSMTIVEVLFDIIEQPVYNHIELHVKTQYIEEIMSKVDEAVNTNN